MRHGRERSLCTFIVAGVVEKRSQADSAGMVYLKTVPSLCFFAFIIVSIVHSNASRSFAFISFLVMKLKRSDSKSEMRHCLLLHIVMKSSLCMPLGN